MHISHSGDDLSTTLDQWRERGDTIAFVPTMGNLHAGHIKLLREARATGGRVVVSIFVNPTQFGVGEDYASYPRTRERDLEQLADAGADLVFLPEVAEIYPEKDRELADVDLGGLDRILCGANRPGHFQGVATVVSILFALVRPDVAIFGRKDFQQYRVIQRLVETFGLPIRLIAVETEREPDGLAMSSRNSYLDAEQRGQAACLSQVLAKICDRLRQGHKDYRAMEKYAIERLNNDGFSVDYVSIRDSDDLSEAGEKTTKLVALAAASLGTTRLIDNMEVEL
ncbi:MAG TPA: pantoate--beta-alanine ligase [Chromatiales bacterium]|nr:pantoate--beta-alanine ligase [Chromatiales bacterium]